MLLHVDEDETADIAQALKPELFFSPPSDATPEVEHILYASYLIVISFRSLLSSQISALTYC
jgi:hypothetical protein